MSTFRWSTMIHTAVVTICAGVALAMMLGLTGGCADTMKFETTMEFLKEGNAKGHLVATTGGSPVQAGMKQVFFLGPEDVSLSFDGDINFGSVSADDLLPREPK